MKKQMLNTRAASRTTTSSGTLPGARRGGITMVEMMIAVAISSTLLAAVGVAIDASFRANTVNQDQSNLTQKARLAMNRIITEIRTTTAHSPITATAQTNFELGKIVTDTGIEMLIGDEKALVLVKYELDPAGRCIWYTAPNKKKYVAVTNVEAFSVKFEPMRSQEAQQMGMPYDQVLRATVLLTVKGDKISGQKDPEETLTLNCSVMPRRNAW
jgi:type II secretory pathway pseudopilin PulG